MSSAGQVADLISECLDRCRASGYTLTALMHFLDEMRKSGHSEVDLRTVDCTVRRILADVIAPDAINESPTATDFNDTTRLPRQRP